jgi:predicted transcriptional regulator
MSAAKKELIKVIEGQPEESTIEEISRALAFHLMILRGLADVDAGRVISDEEIAKRIKSWAE